MRIGELARRTRVAIDTIRYYERLGLLPRAERTPSGYRRFEPEAERRLRFIRRAKELGFTLEEIGELLELSTDRPESCAEVRRRAEERLAVIESRLARLQELRGALANLVRDCEARRPTDDCPILRALDGDDACRC